MPAKRGSAAPQKWKERVNRFQPPPFGRGDQVPTEPQVLRHRQVAEDVFHLRHVAEATVHPLVGLDPLDGLAAPMD
jgi:hypothetical protein